MLSYDGTFEGLLTVLAVAVDMDPPPMEIQTSAESGEFLFNDWTHVSTNQDAAKQFVRTLERVAGRGMLRQIFRVFLAEQPDRERMILNRVLSVFAAGNRGVLSDPEVNRFKKLASRVTMEVNRFGGMLRFEELEDGLLWATYEPDFNITPILGPYFADRMPSERFVICDVRRGAGIYHEMGQLQYAEIPAETIVQLRREKTLRNTPDAYAELWRQYFKGIAIKERKNPKLQQQLMPLKYRGYLAELMIDNC